MTSFAAFSVFSQPDFWYVAIPVALVMLAIGGAGSLVSWVRTRWRSRLFRPLAARLGYEYTVRMPTLLAEYPESFLAKVYSISSIGNVLSNRDGDSRLVYFDFNGTHDNSVHHYSVCVVDVSYRASRLLAWGPRAMGGTPWAVLEWKHFIKLDSAEFNRAFRVWCPGRKFAFEVLHQRAMEFLLKRPGICLNLFDDCVMLWYDRFLSPAEVERLISDTLQFAALLPAYLKRPALEGGRPGEPAPSNALS